MSLSLRGWRQIDDGRSKVPRVEVWRKGTEPFCIELEFWDNGTIRGKLRAPGTAIQGQLVFELATVEEGADFLEKLMNGATMALPQSMRDDPSEP